MSSAKAYVEFVVNYLKKNESALSKFEGKDVNEAAKLLTKYALSASAIKGKWKRDHEDFEFNAEEISAECALRASEFVTDLDDDELILSGSDDILETEKVAPKTVKAADIAAVAKSKPKKTKEPVVDESEEETAPVKPKSKPKKTEVVDESDDDTAPPVKPKSKKTKVEVSDEEKLPAKERKTKKESTTKTKTTKRSTPFTDGVVSYPSAGLDTKVMNRLIKAFEALKEEHEDDLPGLIVLADNLNARNAKDREVTSWRAINIKIQTVNIAVKYSYTYDDGRGESKEGKLDIVKYGVDTPVDDLIDEEKELVKAFGAYLHLYETGEVTKNGKPKKWKLSVQNVLATDLVYKLGALKFEGILDTTHQMPIGKFKIAYDPTDGEALAYREMDYPTIFTLIRYTGDHFTPTKMKNAMKKIYKSRSFIIFHTKVVAAIDGLWEKARANLEAIEERSAVSELWFQVLSSSQCKNIIARGWPARPEFDTMIGELLSEAETRELFCDEMFPICFIFSPLAMRSSVTGMPKAKLEQACVDYFINASATLTRTYAECDWAAGALEDLVEDDKTVFRFWFNKERFLKDKPKKTEKKKEEKEDSDESED